jgi:sirohydrochlorin cobaltochelatase
MRVGVVLVAHGSREPGANREHEALVAEVQRRRPNQLVTAGYIELAAPSVEDATRALASRVDCVVVVPVLLFAAGHVKNDIPLAIDRVQREFPNIRIVASPALGVHPALAETAFARARQSPVWQDTAAERTALILLGRGSSDPDANGDFYKLSRLVGERRGLMRVEPCFYGIAPPTFEDAAEMLARVRPERLVVVPYLLFHGRLVERLADKVARFAAGYPWIRIGLAPHLGAHPALLSLVDERVDGALDGAVPLPCTGCQYRVPVGGVAEQVGGLRALLWSVRHTLTHNQAMPHEHAHAPMAKHVLVCGNADCADRGSLALLSALRRQIKDAGQRRALRVTRTSCMGRCGEGPTVAVYPDGVWYRGVKESDAAELVAEHLLCDRLVARLVDNIMQ